MAGRLGGRRLLARGVMVNPITVAQIGNFTYPWCSEVHFGASLEELGHRVVRLQENRLDWTGLPAKLATEGAQVVMWTRTWPADMGTVLPVLESLRADGVPTVAYHLDRWHGLDREHQVRDQPFFRCALVISPDDSPRWAEDGVNHFWLPPGVYGAECVPVPPNPRRWPHDVVFVGSVPYPHPEWAPYRAELVDRMRKAFGARFGVWPQNRRPVRGRMLQELYATAKVVVGDSCLAGETHRYVSDRVPETLGRGGLLLHPYAEWMEDWWRSDVDLLTYRLGDFDDAIEQARMALDRSDWGRSIAQHGRATVLGRDTYRHRMETMLAEVDRQFGIPEARTTRAKPRTLHADATTPHANATGPEPLMVSHRPTRTRARFHVVPGVETDATAVREVWKDDTYRMTPEMVRGKVVVDIGANIGAFSILAAKAGASRVVAFEPHPDTFDVLTRNAVANACDEQITPRRAAVLDFAGSLLLVGSGGGASINGPGGGVMTDCLAAADAFAVAGTEQIGLVKIDCEGSEYRILDDLDPVWLERTERIVMEFHGPHMGAHLAWLGDKGQGEHRQRWGEMVAKLANYGRLRIEGRPMVGGLLWWERF